MRIPLASEMFKVLRTSGSMKEISEIYVTIQIRMISDAYGIGTDFKPDIRKT